MAVRSVGTNDTLETFRSTFNSHATDTGDLTNLDTTDKGSLVAAINEAFAGTSTFILRDTSSSTQTITGGEVTERIEDIEYTPFNTDGSSDTTITPSESDQVLDDEFKDYKFSVSGLTEFTSFQIKFVFTGSNSSLPARIKDLRGIALAV